ncbi:nucleoside-diphosphate-sugar epimerase [Geomicrobium halophilum]|uniref:Nucleoside-diphosphate-sugar epimerase n=1 Tax=Geomicrobium halophilum TaxID=549000 RepID=A0A841PIK9_9BACL|nr:nucleoside-diphosphate-sugar epimerase [Geomicrobium halophilum]
MEKHQTHIDNVVSANILAAEAPILHRKIINVGEDELI